MTYQERTYRQNKGQTLVEFALLIPIVALFFMASTLFYQSYVQENLYGNQANYERFLEGENPSFGQEMIVGLPIP